MTPNNKEMRQHKNCQLYVYILSEQGKEIPDHILECASAYDYLVDCVHELAQEIEGLDVDTFERIMNDKDSLNARELSYWWEMKKEADKLHKALSSDT